MPATTAAFLVANTGLTFLQVLWGSKIIKQVEKMLFKPTKPTAKK